jgi:hypothetical protein
VPGDPTAHGGGWRARSGRSVCPESTPRSTWRRDRRPDDHRYRPRPRRRKAQATVGTPLSDEVAASQFEQDRAAIDDTAEQFDIFD